MFRTIESSNQTVPVMIEGKPYDVPAGISVAAVVLLCGLKKVRDTPVSNSPRLPYCMMGVCFDCLMKIDGNPNQRACQVIVKPDMVIEQQHGAAGLAEER